MISISSLGPPPSHCNLSSCRCQLCSLPSRNGAFYRSTTSNWSSGFAQLATFANFPTFPTLLFTSVVCCRRAKVAKVVRATRSVLRSLAPSFENFCDQVLGSWKGWLSTVATNQRIQRIQRIQRTQQLLESKSLESLESSVETSETKESSAHELMFRECDTKVTPIMRSCAACAGVVQGTNDWIRLDRDQKGFVFFCLRLLVRR